MPARAMKRITGGVSSSPSPVSQQKSLLKGVFLGMSLPTAILIIVLIRQFGGESQVARSDSGAPLEVAKRPQPLVATPRAPRVVLNRTIRFNESNPYGRAQKNTRAAGKSSASQQKDTSPQAATNASMSKSTPVVLKPWDLREIHAAKQRAKTENASSLFDRYSRKTPLLIKKAPAGSLKFDANPALAAKAKAALAGKAMPSYLKGNSNGNDANDNNNNNDTSRQSSGPSLSSMPKSSIAKPKKVFAASSQGKGFVPGDEVLPEGGVAITSLKKLEANLHAKCVSLVGFYNSEDTDKTKDMATLWRDVYDRHKGKFAFGLVDVRKKDGMAVAVEAGVFPTANDTTPAVGLPSILAYPSRDAANESVVLARGTRRSKLASLPVVVSKALFALVQNLDLPLSKEGCFQKAKTPFHDRMKLKTSTVDKATKSRLGVDEHVAAAKAIKAKQEAEKTTGADDTQTTSSSPQPPPAKKNKETTSNTATS